MKEVLSRYFGRNDYLLLIVVFVGIVAFFALKIYYFDREGVEVVVSVGDEVYGTYPISVDRVIDIKLDDKIANEVVIEDRTVYMKEATCPDKVCVKQGKISMENSSIVCLPHKVVVTVTGNTGVIDTITR